MDDDDNDYNIEINNINTINIIINQINLINHQHQLLILHHQIYKINILKNILITNKIMILCLQNEDITDILEINIEQNTKLQGNN